MSSLYQSLLDILVPPFCHACSVLLTHRTPLCVVCQGTIKPLVSTSLKITTKYTLSVYALSAYEDPLRKLILAKNYSDIIAARQLGIIMAQQGHSLLKNQSLLIPLPLHWTRYAWRGFNQAEVIAKTMGEYTHLPTLSLLKRKRRTPFQATLNATERAENVHHAFTLTHHAHQYHNRHLVLIDDLMTTGATLHAAARELITLKPLSLTALVACRVV